jgi:hypothetical protein
VYGRGRTGRDRAGQGRAGGGGRVGGDLHLIKQKYNFFLIIFIIEHIKKYIIFFKRKKKINK